MVCIYRSDSVSPKVLRIWFRLDIDLRRPRNATIEVIIEEAGFNNSLAGYLNCPSGAGQHVGDDARKIWVSNYLQNGKNIKPPRIL